MRCGTRLEAALGGVDGVVEAVVDLEAGRAWVRHDERCDPAQLVRAIEAASRGTIHTYRARIVSAGVEEPDRRGRGGGSNE